MHFSSCWHRDSGSGESALATSARRVESPARRAGRAEARQRQENRLSSTSSPKASEGWRKRLGVEPSPPAQRGKRPILKTGRATGPRSFRSLDLYPPIPRRYITSFCSSDTTNRHVGTTTPPVRRIRDIVSRRPHVDGNAAAPQFTPEGKTGAPRAGTSR